MNTPEEVVEHQAHMESLWCEPRNVVEAMLIAALRHLHAVIEEDRFIAAETKKIYWRLESEEGPACDHCEEEDD